MSNKLKFSPTIARVYQMKKDILLQHHALVVHKASSLSRKQRDVVQLRVAYGLQEGLYTYEEVQSAITDLGLKVAQEISQKFNLHTDADSIKKHQ